MVELDLSADPVELTAALVDTPSVSGDEAGLAGAVERAGVYTKDGIPRVSGRIGIMEAVG